MKKLLLTLSAVLPLLAFAIPAHAQSYTYDCLCLFSEPGGTCVEYTCDASRRRNTYYGNQYYGGQYYGNQNCDGRYDRYCSSSYYRPTTYYQPRYRDSSSTYYDSRYNYDWYSRRYTGRPSYYYDRSSYDTPYYY